MKVVASCCNVLFLSYSACNNLELLGIHPTIDVILIEHTQIILPYLDLYYRAPPLPKLITLLTIMKFGLDDSRRREPKGCCLSVYSSKNNYHLVAV